MDVLTAIRSRKKCTSFQDQELPKDLLNEIVELAHYAPTGGGHDSREFVVVTDKELMGKLSETHDYMRWLAGAAAAVVIIGKPNESRYWVEDTSIAAEHIWLTATALGLGASWGAVYQSDNPEESRRRENHVRSLLDIPSVLRPVAVMALGYPKEEQVPRSTTKLPLLEVAHDTRYGTPWRVIVS